MIWNNTAHTHVHIHTHLHSHTITKCTYTNAHLRAHTWWGARVCTLNGTLVIGVGGREGKRQTSPRVVKFRPFSVFFIYHIHTLHWCKYTSCLSVPVTVCNIFYGFRIKNCIFFFIIILFIYFYYYCYLLSV